MNERQAVEVRSGPEEAALLRAVTSSGRPATLEAVATGLGKTLAETLDLMAGLQRRGLLTYTLTTGYTPTGDGVALVEADRKAGRSMTETGTIAHRTVGARMPTPLSAPEAANSSPKKQEKFKRMMRSRERTRDRLRQLAQESGLQRRKLRTLRD